MNKADLTNAVATKTGMSKKQSAEAVNAVVEAITGSLAKGESVQLVGFGTFSAQERPERQGKNPQTGKKMTIPACTVPKFKAGKTLKDAVK